MALDPAGRRDLHWSHKEKSVARAAFDGALARETAAIRKKAEELLQRSSEPTAVWDVLEFLSKKRYSRTWTRNTPLAASRDCGGLGPLSLGAGPIGVWVPPGRLQPHPMPRP